MNFLEKIWYKIVDRPKITVYNNKIFKSEWIDGRAHYNVGEYLSSIRHNSYLDQRSTTVDLSRDIMEGKEFLKHIISIPENIHEKAVIFNTERLLDEVPLFLIRYYLLESKKQEERVVLNINKDYKT